MPAHISLSIHNTEKLSFLGDNFISAFYQGMYIISRSCQKKNLDLQSGNYIL